MDLAPLIPWLSAAALIISLGTSVVALLNTGTRRNGDQITALQKVVNDQDRRISSIENELKHLPDKEVVHRLELTLSEMKSDIVKIAASADQSARTTQRVENYLMERGR